MLPKGKGSQGPRPFLRHRWMLSQKMRISSHPSQSHCGEGVKTSLSCHPTEAPWDPWPLKFTCLSLIINDVENFFMSLLAILYFIYELLIHIHILCPLSCETVFLIYLCIMDINHLLYISHHFLGCFCLSTLFMEYFALLKYLLFLCNQLPRCFMSSGFDVMLLEKRNGNPL